MEYEVTKDIKPFNNPGKIWIQKGEKVKEIAREGNASIIEYKGQRYPVNIQYLVEPKKEEPKEKPVEVSKEIQPNVKPVAKPIPVKIKKKEPLQRNLF